MFVNHSWSFHSCSRKYLEGWVSRSGTQHIFLIYYHGKYIKLKGVQT